LTKIAARVRGDRSDKKGRPKAAESLGETRAAYGLIAGVDGMSSHRVFLHSLADNQSDEIAFAVPQAAHARNR
jgi:hypothetical protein